MAKYLRIDDEAEADQAELLCEQQEQRLNMRSSMTRQCTPRLKNKLLKGVMILPRLCATKEPTEILTGLSHLHYERRLFNPSPPAAHSGLRPVKKFRISSDGGMSKSLPVLHAANEALSR